MKKYTNEMGKRVTAAVVAAVCCMSACAGAEDSASGSSYAEAANYSVNRPVVAKATSVGGLRAGEALKLDGRSVERVDAPVPAGAQCAVAQGS